MEWAWLNRPERLARLAEIYRDRLALAPLVAERYGTVAAIPYPRPEELDPVAAALEAAASSILAQHAGVPEPVPELAPDLLPVIEGAAPVAVREWR